MPTKKIDGKYLKKPFKAFKIKYKDLFTLNELYKALYEWMQEYNWRAPHYKHADGAAAADNIDYLERYYYHKQDAGGMTEHFIFWRLEKNPNNNTRLKWYLDINFHTLALKPTEVLRDNKKIKTDKGEVEIEIQAYLEKVYAREMDSNQYLKLFKKLFTEQAYHDQIEQSEKDLYHEAYLLQNFIKQWFKLKRYQPYEETKSFHPSHAYPSHR